MRMRKIKEKQDGYAEVEEGCHFCIEGKGSPRIRIARNGRAATSSFD